MRLQLISTALACALGYAALPAHANAQAARPLSVDHRSSVYLDTDHTLIGTSTTRAAAAPAESVTLRARYLLDAVSSASIDVVSAATGRWEELRHEAAAGASVTADDTTISADYVYSLENDWQSHTASLGISVEALGHALTLSVDGTLQYNDIWRSHDQNFRREMWLASGSARAVWVSSPTDLWSLGYGLTWHQGYQASPYRYARILDGSGLLHWSPEIVPEQRVRHAITLRWNHSLDPAISLRPHARIYFDDWGIVSGTLGTDLVGTLGEWEIGGFVRGYAQSGAAFYDDIYAAPARYMTSDRELSMLFDGFGGMWIGIRSEPTGPFHQLRAELRATAFGFWMPDFARLPSRYGGVLELALGGDL